jgi:hypothetical protein
LKKSKTTGAGKPAFLRGQKMKIRADFDFKEEAMGIKSCKGYVIGEFTPTEEGGDFKPEDVILERLVARSPDLKKIEALAIANCMVLYDDNEVEEVINVGSLADYHD